MNPALTTWIFRTNVVLFAILLAILFGFPFDEASRFLRLSGSAIFLAVIFVLPAINATAILAKVSRRTFDRMEFLVISAVISILLIPFLVSIQADTLHILSPHLPLMNASVSFLLFSVLFRSNREMRAKEATLFEENEHHSVRASFTASLLIVGASITAIVAAYYPLPDLDPYYWVTIFQDQFGKGVISSISSYRPLFSSLAYLFSQSAGVDLYAFFKYLLPFAALLPLLPAMLVARRFARPIEQAGIFLLPVANASFFLYSTMPIPQAIFNSLLITAVFFSLHSLFSGKKIFFHIAGAILFIGFFYHEMAAIPLLAWLLSFLFFERTRIVNFAKTNRVAATLLFLLILSNLPILSPAYSFISSWTDSLFRLIQASTTNFAFPAEYVNIDGNNVGWQDASGVIRYYAFYFGPAALLALILFPLILKHPGTRALLKREESWFLLLSLGAFLLMSDILPRFVNIALLPERALGFVSVFLLSFVPIIFLALHGKKILASRLVPALLLIALLVNIGAALHINDLKKYLITPAQLTSAEWIRSQLPANRIIFSVGSHKLLKFYANSVVAEVDDPAFYADERIFEQHLDAYDPKDPDHVDMIRKRLSRIADTLDDLSNLQTSDSAAFLAGIKTGSAGLEDVHRLIREAGDVKQGSSPERYIYYAAPSEKNPYINRPYMPASIGGEIDFLFDRYPERFRMVYSDMENEIYIWEIL
jgi:hypothetical protein